MITFLFKSNQLEERNYYTDKLKTYANEQIFIKLITSINPRFVSNFLHFPSHILLCFLFFSCCRYTQSNTNKSIFHPPPKQKPKRIIFTYW